MTLRVNVFQESPALLDGVAPEQRPALVERGVVAARVYAARTAGPASEPPGDGFGLLVLDGLLSRSVTLSGRTALELLGPGDVLRPWDDSRGGAPVPIDGAWRVLAETRVAVLDRSFVARVAAWPEVTETVCARLVDRSRWLALLLLLARLPHVEARLLVLFWHLADRWGEVRRDGTIGVPLRLTHETLGALVTAERPTVTVALKRLAEHGALVRERDEWVLHVSPPTAAELERQAFADAFRIRRD
jgi:CRP/FNR family cyclic AMP-dependent transcriptional regulator